MGVSDSNASSKGIYDAIQGGLQLFRSINKTPSAGDQSITPADEYESTYSEERIIQLKAEWMKLWERYYADILSSQDLAYSYWLGKQKTDAQDEIEGVRIVDNRIFAALETFLPIATRANPDPLVTADNSPEGQTLAKNVKHALVHLADKQKLRMKLKSGVRNWALMRLGVWRIDYDYVKDDIEITVVHPKRMILDPNGAIDDAGNFDGEWIGERLNFSASRLIEMFPDKKQKILDKARGKKGTDLEIIRWWYKGTDTFFTLDNIVLAKKKNPHWNWDGVIQRLNPDTQEMEDIEIQGRNHFPTPMANYVFLSIFKTGIQPHDDTSLLLQNITLQDQVNKRYKQLDKNVDSQNNGIIVDGRMMDQAQASEAASALRLGASIRVMGDVDKAFKRADAPQLPSDVWESLRDAREELNGIFGISGSTSQGVEEEDTVRGKILATQQDSSRIGGGVTEYIEQAADTIYNWMVQLMYVHYDNEHFFNAVGAQEGQEMIVLKNSRLIYDLTVTVKEGSLIPKDPLTKRNEAMDLWSAGAIDPLTLFTRLESADPVQDTTRLILWQQVQKGDPQALQMYLPNFQQTVMQQLGMNPPNVAPNGQPNAQTEQPQQTTGTQPPEQVQSQQLIQSVPMQA